ncbi:unnamed protein product [Gongylonema pulchrum]|uniref:SNX17_FERM_C domain-containing protein n=1 Tax=Gongylonema pulchrum TaxID=637853 RepID=A0A183E7H9_9BILA|nr:unnamed protein product [Gongylonema pulchrum]
MADGTKETIRCNVEHPTDIVLKRFAEQIGMNIENIGNFGLFLAKRRYNNSNNAHYISSESFRPSSSNVSVDVFMADGTKETIRCNVEHPTDIVLKRFAEQIGMNIENIGNFGLFLAKRRYNNSNDAHYISSVCSTQYPDSLCVRLLRSFESPYLSTHLLNQKSAAAGVFYYAVGDLHNGHFVPCQPEIKDRLLALEEQGNCLQRLYFPGVRLLRNFESPYLSTHLLNQKSAAAGVFCYAVGDLHNGHFVPCQPEIKDRLLALEEQGNCLQFLRLCHLQPNYGYEVLEPCLSDYPRLNTECSLKVGRRHILLEFSEDHSKVVSFLFFLLVICLSVRKFFKDSFQFGDFSSMSYCPTFTSVKVAQSWFLKWSLLEFFG